MSFPFDLLSILEPRAAAQIVRAQWSSWEAHKDDDALWTPLVMRASIRQRTDHSIRKALLTEGDRDLFVPDAALYRWPGLAHMFAVHFDVGWQMKGWAEGDRLIVANRNVNHDDMLLVSHGRVERTALDASHYDAFVMARTGRHFLRVSPSSLALYAVGETIELRYALMPQPMLYWCDFMGDVPVVAAWHGGGDTTVSIYSSTAPTVMRMVTVAGQVRQLCATDFGVAVQLQNRDINVYNAQGEFIKSITSQPTLHGATRSAFAVYIPLDQRLELLTLDDTLCVIPGRNLHYLGSFRTRGRDCVVLRNAQTQWAQIYDGRTGKVLQTLYTTFQRASFAATDTHLFCMGEPSIILWRYKLMF